MSRRFSCPVEQTIAITRPSGIATFAVGCFWCVELHFQREAGVLSTTVGYTNDDVSSEAVQLMYDSNLISYEALLHKFWSLHDANYYPKGNRSGIYFHSNEQHRLALHSKTQRDIQNGSISLNYTAIDIKSIHGFHKAEDHHQQHLQKGGQSAAPGCRDAIHCLAS